MRTLMKPGVMLSNIWPNSRETEGETLRGLEKAVELDFFEAIQVVDIPHPSERKAFAELLRESGLPGNMAMTRVLNLNGLNLSSLDPDLRSESVEKIRAGFDEVCESGMSQCTVISGPRPEGEEDRLEALKLFQDSLHRLCLAAEQHPGLVLQFEPLDYFAHKRMTLGTADEGLAIARELRKPHSNLTLCLDTAHMILNEEDIVEGFKKDLESVTEFHFCNPCLDRDHEKFGDRHLPLGPPGAMNRTAVANLMVAGRDAGFFSEDSRPTVAFEILSSEELKGTDLLKYCRDSFLACWEEAESTTAR